MDCAACRERLTEYCAGALDVEMNAAVRSHLDACAGCRAELAAEKLLDAVLASAPLREPPSGFTATVMTRTGAASRHEAALVGWMVTVASMLSAIGLAMGLDRLVEALSRAPGARGPLAAWPAVSRILGLRDGTGSVLGGLPLPMHLPLHLPPRFPDVLQMGVLGSLVTAAVITLILSSLWTAGRALHRGWGTKSAPT